MTHHRGYDLLRASACVCCEVAQHRGYGLYWHRLVYIVRSHMHMQGVRFVTGIGVCMLCITGGRVCYGHRRVYVVRSHITGGTICYGRRRVYVMRSHITGGTVWYGHRRVYVVRSHITGGRFVTGIGTRCKVQKAVPQGARRTELRGSYCSASSPLLGQSLEVSVSKHARIGQAAAGPGLGARASCVRQLSVVVTLQKKFQADGYALQEVDIKDLEMLRYVHP